MTNESIETFAQLPDLIMGARRDSGVCCDTLMSGFDSK
jgi:hypothetical protein